MYKRQQQTFSLAIDHSPGRGEYSADNAESPGLDAANIGQFKTSSRKTSRRLSPADGGLVEGTMLAMGPSAEHLLSSTAQDAGLPFSRFRDSAYRSMGNVFPAGITNACNLEVVITATVVGGLVVRQLPGRKGEEQKMKI